MRRKLKIKLRTRLLIYVLSATAVIYTGALFYIIHNTKIAIESESEKFVDASLREHAYEVQVELNGDISVSRAVANSYMDYKEIPREQREKIYNGILENILIDNPQYVSFWSSWELNAIDPEYNRLHGRERYTFFREDGKINFTKEILETDVTEVSGSYYEIKASKKEVITEPYWFSYENSDAKFLMASVCVPLLDEGRFIGLVGADVELERFHSIVKNIKPFEGSYAMMLSHKGMIVSHPNHDLINTPVTDSEFGTGSKMDINKMIKTGKAFSFYTKIDGKAFYTTFTPFLVGQSEDPWYIGILVPQDVILQKANALVLISIFVGLIGFLLIGLIVWYVAKHITTPLTQTTKILKNLSKGFVEDGIIVKVSTNDEIAEMAEALDTLMVSLKGNARFANEIGKGIYDSSFEALGKEDKLGNALLKMRQNLVQLRQENHSNNWMQESILKVSEILQGEKSTNEIATQVLSALAEILDVQLGALFVEDDGIYRMVGSYAYNIRKTNSNVFKPGQGLVGQAVLEQKPLLFTDSPVDYITIKSGLGESKPNNILVIPLVYQKFVVAVIELGTAKSFTKTKMEFISQVSENIAISINSIKIRTEMKLLLAKTQEQTEELRVQQEELREANEELEQQTHALKDSEQELQQQQEELRVTNEELEEKTMSLEEQKSEITDKNLKLENAGKDLERKAKELAVASKYKSEFLANMSHELRTPLNSLLILSQSLSENQTKNLSEDQVESAEIIYQSGTDLLNMINDILDLSKIESGKMIINYETVKVKSVSDIIFQYFKHVTDQKGIGFKIGIAKDVPISILTDQQKVQQIIKNFVSNAIKFTKEGGVEILFHNVDSEVDLSRSNLEHNNAIGISVSDTGIGIPEDKQLEIFEAFQQVDGSTSRLYGGTGLGLSISRELAKILGGEIQLKSELGVGSSFTVYLPVISNGDKNNEKQTVEVQRESQGATQDAPVVVNAQPRLKPAGLKPISEKIDFIPDDRDNIDTNDLVILVIEDDPNFAKILLKQCHEKQFKCIATPIGEDGYDLAKKHCPGAIILDLNLPGMNGGQVLDLLKNDPNTRHIPVHIMSGEDENLNAYKKGAIGYLTKPIKKNELDNAFIKLEGFIKRKMSQLLIVEDDKNLRKSIKVLIGEEDVEITDASTGKQAIELIKNKRFDCIVLDLGLPDMTGFELVKQLERDETHKPPIIVYTGKDLSREESDELQKYAETVIIKGVKSEERLLDETALFLHRMVDKMPENQQSIIQKLHNAEDIFKDKKILLVDDDMRNVFALSKILSEKGIQVIRADNGKTAIDLLHLNKDVHLILMDIMMPVMDGIEAIKIIRKTKDLKKVPIIALTAKAMKEDRDKCINAGASDYMTKPINVEKLLSLMRVWLYK
jgi:CheY-like chemotaxis protein